MKSELDTSLRPQQFKMSTPRSHWIVAIFLLVVQQGAFVEMPLIMADASLKVQNPFNTFAMIVSVVLLLIARIPKSKQIYVLVFSNRSAVFYTLIVLASALWSIHPGTSLLRGASYVLTMFVAFYISVRFSIDDRIKVFSWSVAISAIGSILFIAAFPQYGIMVGVDETGALDGNWRGVFSHKEGLGDVMACGVFTELYLIALRNGRPGWRFISISVYIVLLKLSQSTTALIVSLLYIACASMYLIWKRNKLIAYAVSILFVFVLFSLLGFLLIDPDLVFGLMGKDSTLTGRTGLWSAVMGLIKQRPLLGWGYRAMWAEDDPTTVMVDELTGGWGVPSAHNAFLEITLELGLLGLFAILLIVGIAFWRGLRCCKMGILPLGWFSLMFFIGVTLAGLAGETLGLNQLIGWVLFNVLSFSCEQCLALKWTPDLGPRVKV